ncbi:sperm acrosome membrane-associated protein 6 [Perognathus longimembris pacificus]|uniref:sperm acrosome membrane-associated protein 6 n=1 Tax=Perognathus longimembris pacificus TaxID=214514 RepID=UPI002018453B|nr:sperm acrosome membrane-associated protein 6 [Perognathus longimembris pacificus]
MALAALVNTVVSLLLALLVFRVSTWACLLCFTTYSERIQICKMFVGGSGSKTKACEKTLELSFNSLQSLEIDYDQRNYVHDTFLQMGYSLQEMATAKWTHREAFHEAAVKMKVFISQLKKAHTCIPPCGVQELTRRFICNGCYSLICKLPLNCPIQDVIVNPGDQAMFSCVVDFQLPKEQISYSWKFAKVRTQDMSYFHDLPLAQGFVARVRPVKYSHRGTYSCMIKHDLRPLARLYFFLNVTGPAPPGESKLQIAFREVVRWARTKPEVMEPWKPSVVELLASPWTWTWEDLCELAAIVAVVSATLTVLVWMFCRWYCSGP